MEEFYKDKDYLKTKYEIISSGLEGDIYKFNYDKIVKKYHRPVDKDILIIDFLIRDLKLKKFRYSLNNLVDNKVYASLYNYFDGKIIGDDIKDINLDFLIRKVEEIIKEISILSYNNIMINDLGKKDVLYNNNDIIVIDTNSYDLNNYLSKDVLYNYNLRQFLISSGIFEIPEIYYFAKDNKDIKDLILDLDNYSYLLVDLKKELEKRCEDNITTINEGLSKIKLKK